MKKSSSSKNKNKSVYEISLEEYVFDKPPIYEYDNSLDEYENIKRKNILIQYGRALTREKQYNNAILYYKYLSNNTYFTNDYYPYRQLSIIYGKTENHSSNIINIKKLLYSKIYLNEYQFTWFLERIRQIADKTFVGEDEIQDWIDYYHSHGALYEKKLNKFLADRFITSGDKIVVISEDEFDHRQERFALEEVGRIYERVGNYNLAITHYSNIIGSGDFNYYQFYQRLCMCLEKINDYKRELKAIDLYFRLKPLNKSDSSDDWFAKRRKMAEGKLSIDDA